MLRQELGKRTFASLLTAERGQAMENIRKGLDAEAREYGAQVIDVRIKRADLPQANSQSVYNRMKTDREREAGQLRAQGDEENQRIKATADREVAVIKADAGLTAQTTMGAADGEAAKIYADTFSRDKDFYAFWRRMEAYKQAFSGGGSTMILGPDSDFFRYFNEPPGAAPAAKK